MSSCLRQENLGRALRPRSICFIGGSFLEPSIDSVRRLGFDGTVSVVNPRRKQIAGHTCFDSVQSLPEPPDVALIAVNRELTVSQVAELREKGAGGAVCYAAGFSETGEHGRDLEEKLHHVAGDLALIGPNCYGYNNHVDGIPLMVYPTHSERTERGCALIVQSGNLAINLANSQRAVPLAYLISCGNQAVLEISDYMAFLVDDPAVSCFALFIEGLKDVRRFARVARRALELGKPVIALKSGISSLGARMAVSHTASLAGDDSLYQALFDRLNIIRVETPADLLETAKMITVTGVPRGRKLAVFTCSGGDSEAVADLVEPYGGIFPQPSPEHRNAMQQYMQVFTSISNPLDYNTDNWGNREVLTALFSTMMLEDVDAGYLVIDSWSGSTDDVRENATVDAAVLALNDAGKARGVPCATACVIPENVTPRQQGMFHEMAIASLNGIREGTLALIRTCIHGERRDACLERAHELSTPAVVSGQTRTLDEAQGKALLAEIGLTLPESRVVHPSHAVKAAEEIGFPVVVKVLADTVLHKSDVAGVSLDLRNATDVEHAVRDMESRLGISQLLVESMLPSPVAEMIVGVTTDSDFGQVLVIGAGGILVELYKDSATLLLPVTEDDVLQAIDGLTVSRLLRGYRGRPACDLTELVLAIMKIAQYAGNHSERIVELEVNPLFVMPAGQPPIVADALVRVVRGRN